MEGLGIFIRINDAQDAHDELAMFASYVVGHVLPGLADFHGSASNA
jgi:hypothetical protein